MHRPLRDGNDAAEVGNDHQGHVKVEALPGLGFRV